MLQLFIVYLHTGDGKWNKLGLFLCEFRLYLNTFRLYQGCMICPGFPVKPNAAFLCQSTYDIMVASLRSKLDKINLQQCYANISIATNPMSRRR